MSISKAAHMSVSGPDRIIVGSSYRRVCYFTDWSRYRQGLGKYTVYDVEPFLCTHIVYAFGTFDSGGKVKPFDPGPDKKK